MPRNFIFFVTEASWQEHLRAGIAAINDPMQTGGTQGMAKRQVAISEISGIAPGDRIFFRLSASDGNPRIIGLFRATSTPYWNEEPVFDDAKVVNGRLPFRVDFEVERWFPNGVQMQYLWHLRDSGKLWNLQQSRGDIVGRHACVSIADDEADAIIDLLEANNLVELPAMDLNSARKQCRPAALVKNPLPLNLATRNGRRNLYPGRLHYEATLQSLLLSGMARGMYRDLLGSFSSFITFPTTGSGTEIDLLCYKAVNNKILWYNVIELKPGSFTKGELQKLIDYERWILRSRASNSLQVHSTGIGYSFDKDVIEFVRKRSEYRDRPITLLQYKFDEQNQTLLLEKVSQ